MAAGIAALWLLACASEPAPAPPELAPASDPRQVSGDAAFAHLEALVDIGPRVSGTPGAERARAYVRQQLEALGLVVEEIRGDYLSPTDGPIELVNLSSRIPGTGAGDGMLVLAAPMDTSPEPAGNVGANEGGSGVALLLELARAIQADPLPYGVELLFFDGEAYGVKPLLGSRIVAAEYARLGILDDIRVLVLLDEVGDADLSIHRDLMSHRVYREVFFDAAAREGLDHEFDRTAPFDQIVAGHVSFFRVGMRRVVALADVRYGGDEVPGTHWRNDDELAQCRPESLERVGRVVLAGLRDVAARQLLVDANLRPAPLAPEDQPLQPSAGGAGADGAALPEPTSAP